jgi:hypothetical protein
MRYQSAHQSLLNRRLDGSVSCNAQLLHPDLPDLMTGLDTRAQCH